MKYTFTPLFQCAVRVYPKAIGFWTVVVFYEHTPGEYRNEPPEQISPPSTEKYKKAFEIFVTYCKIVLTYFVAYGILNPSKGGVIMKVGYVRVSTDGQNTARQDILMKELGVEKVFVDKVSGKNTNRPQLIEMMKFVREGDTVVVSEIARFARNTKDLLTLIDELTSKGVQFESQKEKIDTTTPTGQFMLTVFGAVSQLEREYILARQREGIDAKKAEGGYNGRPPMAIDWNQFEQEYKLWKSGQITAVTAMKHLDLKPNTFYRRVKEYESGRGE